MALCCLLAVGLVLVSTIYCTHAIEGEDHCECPVCRVFSMVGVAYVLVLTVAVVAAACRRRRTAQRDAETCADTPVLLAVKLNC